MKSIVIILMSCLVAVTVSAQGIIRRPAATKPKPTVRKTHSRGSSAVRPKPAHPKKEDPINSLAELPPQETHGRYGAGRGRYVYDG